MVATHLSPLIGPRDSAPAPREALSGGSPDRTATPTPAVRSLATVMTAAITAATIVMFLLFGAITYLGSDDLMGSIGVGVFAASWGGPGFGSMVGGTIWTLQEERLTESVRRHDASEAC